MAIIGRPPYVAKPEDFGSLQLWLRADKDVFLDSAMTTPVVSTGDLVGGWKDQSGRGNNVIQATGANKPSLVVGQLNDSPVIRFGGTDADNVLSIVAGHTLPYQAPITVFAVATTNQLVPAYRPRIASFQTGSNVGWGFGQTLNFPAVILTKYAVADQNSQLNNWTTSEYVITAARFDSGFDTTVFTNGWRRGRITSAANTNAGAATFNIGASASWNENWDGDIVEVLVYASELTDGEVWQVSQYLARKYELPIAPILTAQDYLTTPTYDGSGEVVHPSVYYNATGWNGYAYWMAMTPFPDSQAVLENPSVLVSDDGITWIEPPGISNPIVAAPGGGAINSDPDIVVDNDGTMWLIYREYLVATYDKIYALSSADGITWGASTLILDLGPTECLSPALLWDGSQWVMYSVDHSVPSGQVDRRTAASITGPWSAPAAVTFNTPMSFNEWHLDVILAGGQYYMLMQDLGTNPDIGGLYLAISSDGVNWSYDLNCRIPPGPYAAWDSTTIYHGTHQMIDEVLHIWYSAEYTTGGTDYWHVGKTRYFLI